MGKYLFQSIYWFLEVKKMSENNKKKEYSSNFMLCTAFGIAFGMVFNLVPIGLAFGMLCGVILDNTNKK